MTANITTEVLTDDPVGINQAASILSRGGVVGFPTETVYGLGGDARNSRAVAAIFAAKSRPHFNPLIVHVTTVADAHELTELDEVAERLAAAFWPGPLTLVLPQKPNNGLSELVCAGLSTIAVRVPKNPVATSLLAKFDGPLAAPSANRSGRISPTTSAHVIADLSGRIDAVIDSGSSTFGLESTVVMTRNDGRVEILRPGAITSHAIEKIIGSPPCSPTTGEICAPGSTAMHYAPNCGLRLNAISPSDNEVYLGFGETAGRCEYNLSKSGDLVEAAANLFSAMRELERLAGQSGKTIAVSAIPRHGLGAAINDRLTRAAQVES